MSNAISRIHRLVQRRASTPLAAWNQLSAGKAATQLLSCCGSRSWARTLAARRPFASPEALLEAGEALWFALPEADWLEAFACHPRIGEKKAATTTSLAYAEAEQAAAQESLGEVALALAQANRLYLRRFGFIYIVFASGRSAPELLEILNERLMRSREEELQEAARQQMLITNLRLKGWLKI